LSRNHHRNELPLRAIYFIHLSVYNSQTQLSRFSIYYIKQCSFSVFRSIHIKLEQMSFCPKFWAHGSRLPLPQFSTSQRSTDSFLIGNGTFDLRVYCFLCSLRLLRISVYRGVVAQLCSEEGGSGLDFSRITNVGFSRSAKGSSCWTSHGALRRSCARSSSPSALLRAELSNPATISTEPIWAAFVKRHPALPLDASQRDGQRSCPRIPPGSQRQPLCVELWNACASVLLKRATNLPFELSATLLQTVAALSAVDSSYLSGLVDVSARSGPVQAVHHYRGDVPRLPHERHCRWR
jgi:hypothetical protein